MLSLTQYINGLTNVSVETKEDMEVSKSKMFKVVHVEDNGGTDALEFYDFPPGSIVAVSVCLNDIQSEALSRVRGTLLHQVHLGLFRNALNCVD